MMSVKQGGIKYHFYVWYTRPEIEPQITDKHSNNYANYPVFIIKKNQNTIFC